jgi:predicted RNA polymerase sigma factor
VVSDAQRAAKAVWRIESARLIAGLTRLVNDFSLAEDLAQDALVAALEQWPGSGIPSKLRTSRRCAVSCQPVRGEPCGVNRKMRISLLSARSA